MSRAPAIRHICEPSRAALLDILTYQADISAVPLQIGALHNITQFPSLGRSFLKFSIIYILFFLI